MILNKIRNILKEDLQLFIEVFLFILDKKGLSFQMARKHTVSIFPYPLNGTF
jgi:hypothetical protein